MTFFSIFSIGIDINRLMIPGKNIKIKNLIDNLVIMFLYIFTKDNYFFSDLLPISVHQGGIFKIVLKKVLN